jgi:hypothetical protein
MHTHQAQPRRDIGAPPPAPIAWLAETEHEGETHVAIVWAQHAQRAKSAAAPVLEQPLHELVRVKPAVFKGFAKPEAS